MLLLLAQVLSASLGIMLEDFYKTSSNAWREGLFFMVSLAHHVLLVQVAEDLSASDMKQHLFALPLFLPLYPAIAKQMLHLVLETQSSTPLQSVSRYALNTPSRPLLLVLNALTQFLCIRGVNLLISASSAVSVCITLTLRKLLSLVISVWYFGTPVSGLFVVGTLIVFSSAMLYAADEWKS